MLLGASRASVFFKEPRTDYAWSTHDCGVTSGEVVPRVVGCPRVIPLRSWPQRSVNDRCNGLERFVEWNELDRPSGANSTSPSSSIGPNVASVGLEACSYNARTFSTNACSSAAPCTRSIAARLPSHVRISRTRKSTVPCNSARK